MKKIGILLLILSGMVSGGAFAQTTKYHEEHQTLKKKKSTANVTKQSKDSLIRDSAPILNDNGTVNTTGTIEGRSSTGRTSSDSVSSYTVRKRKRTITTGGAVVDTLKKP